MNTVLQPAPARDGMLAAVVLKLLDDAAHAVDADRETAKASIARASALVLAERDKLVPLRRDTRTPRRSGLAPWQLRRVVRYVDENLTMSIRMSELVKTMELSVGYFSRAFKCSMGQTFSSYVIQRRVELAQQLMLTTNDSLCHIAYACGLADQAHFSKLFRRVVGNTPKAWRRERCAGRAERSEIAA